MFWNVLFFFFSSRRRHTRYIGDWSSDVCSSDLGGRPVPRMHSQRHLLPLKIALPRRIAVQILAERRHYALQRQRSEERRVGKECRGRWEPAAYKKKRRQKQAREKSQDAE